MLYKNIYIAQISVSTHTYIYMYINLYIHPTVIRKTQHWLQQIKYEFSSGPPQGFSFMTHQIKSRLIIGMYGVNVYL